jgi:hypothetical protein
VFRPEETRHDGLNGAADAEETEEAVLTEAGNHATTESGEEDTDESNDTSLRWRVGLSKYQPAPQLLQSVNQETNNTRLGQKRPRIGKEAYTRKRARATVIRATPPRIHVDTRSDTGQNVGAVHAEGDHQMAEGAAECEPVFEAAGEDDAQTQRVRTRLQDRTESNETQNDATFANIEAGAATASSTIKA